MVPPHIRPSLTITLFCSPMQTCVCTYMHIYICNLKQVGASAGKLLSVFPAYSEARSGSGGGRGGDGGGGGRGAGSNGFAQVLWPIGEFISVAVCCSVLQCVAV